MHSAFLIWEAQGRPNLSLRFLKELNYYAAHLLSPYPGLFRNEIQQNVNITNTPHTPPKWEDVEQHMAEFIGHLFKLWDNGSATETAAYALWRINWIHPFVQGNGRTARACCYFILCQKTEIWLPGVPILPELIRTNRDEYCSLLQDADEKANGYETDLASLTEFLERLLIQQLQSAQGT